MHSSTNGALRDLSMAGATQIPEAVPLPRATAIFGLSRSTLYRLAGDGQIRFMKVGRTTLVDAGTVRAFLASLPTASIRAPQQAA